LIDQRAYDDLLDKVEGLYVKLIKELRTVNSTIPILVHGYDYAIPLPDQSGKGSLLPLDGWLGEPMRKMGIVDATIQR
uniref:hypothetical protein n=1 Tax=Streptococcus pneumoniae TaxID=1313 RepID=UPI001952FA61